MDCHAKFENFARNDALSRHILSVRVAIQKKFCHCKINPNIFTYKNNY
ncbi:hypothetical protein HFN_0757 [Helicobacter fennelliae MRY12-0050]|uniref:Uncharacterized protein n=1 Tax=Helicobacter fennelliae MRY12-0050 TaxID=1325130 RepID=T1DWL7_9HELI|nr:hypothetical protein HFN_0757 [Helicobacter fennelliae MRY12-0050]